MTTYLTTVHMIFDVDHEKAEIPDVLNCILTEEMRKYSGKEKSLIDWAFANDGFAADSINPIMLPEGYEPDKTPFPHPVSAAAVTPSSPLSIADGLAKALRDAAAADIWYDAASHGDDDAAKAIDLAKEAMETAAGILSILDSCRDLAATKPHKVSILWGKDLEDGQPAETYEFGTKAELDAFMEGVEAYDGWMGYEVVEEGYVHHFDNEGDDGNEENEA